LRGGDENATDRGKEEKEEGMEELREQEKKV
jgi:hypothetical protein